MAEAQDLTSYLGLGAKLEGEGVRFRVYTDSAKSVEVWLYEQDGATVRKKLPLDRGGSDVYSGHAAGEGHGTLYRIALDGVAATCPYARFLPLGVDGPAMVFATQRDPRVSHGLRPLSQYVIYELHVGTFTPEGSYRAAIGKLDYLRELGVTAIELMPISSFPGKRGWGYDGVAHFAPYAPYGTPDDLRDFLDHAHDLGFSVLLDVVYNHFGPAGCSLPQFSSGYFHQPGQRSYPDEGDNPWGSTLDFGHAPLRAFVLDNARYWIEEVGFDGLRLDAVHAVLDRSVPSILELLVDEVQRVFPQAVIIAEDDRNDPAIVESVGCDAFWADDFHHQLRVTQTGESGGYYAAYTPSVEKLAETIREGYLFRGETFAPSKKPRGKPAPDLPAQAFVYCIENHDQVGNRALGDRLVTAISVDAYCAASSLLLFLPMTPLLFMGQEWAARTPFPFFSDHEAALGDAIRSGRKREFAELHGDLITPPDPQAESTFLSAKIDWQEQEGAEHARVLKLYRRLLQLRQTQPVLASNSRAHLHAEAEGPDADLLVVRRTLLDEDLLLFVNFAKKERPWPKSLPSTASLVLRTDEREFGKSLAAESACMVHMRRVPRSE